MCSTLQQTTKPFLAKEKNRLVGHANTFRRPGVVLLGVCCMVAYVVARAENLVGYLAKNILVHLSEYESNNCTTSANNSRPMPGVVLHIERFCRSLNSALSYCKSDKQRVLQSFLICLSTSWFNSHDSVWIAVWFRRVLILARLSVDTRHHLCGCGNCSDIFVFRAPFETYFDR